MMNRNAFALSIVLWIVAALLLGVSILITLAKDSSQLSIALNDKLQTKLIAEDTLEAFKFYVLTASNDHRSLLNTHLNFQKFQFPEQMVLDNRWYKINNSTKIRIQDTSGLINVYRANANEIAFLASSQRQERLIIKDSIIDWKDTNNIPSLNGAEASVYNLQKNLNFTPRNHEGIQAVEEMRIINGLDVLSSSAWNNLKKYLYYGKGAKVNLFLADNKMLEYYLKVNTSVAENFIFLRRAQAQKYISLLSNLKNYIDDDMGFYLSKEMIIEIIVSKGLASSRLKVHLDFNIKSEKSYTTYEVISF